MNCYSIESKSIKDIFEFMEICIEKNVDFGKISLEYEKVKGSAEEQDCFLKAELESGSPVETLEEIIKKSYLGREKRFLYFSRILKNIDREINKISKIGEIYSENDYFVTKVETEFGEFHALLTAMVRVSGNISDNMFYECCYLDQFRKTPSKLQLAANYLKSFRKISEIAEVPDQLKQISEQMIASYAKFEKDIRDAEYLGNADMDTTWEIELNYEEEWDALMDKSSALLKKSLGKLDEFIGQNIRFRIPEKVVT